jgi:hypothetical protein
MSYPTAQTGLGHRRVSSGMLGRSILVGILLLSVSFTLGCATVVVPVKPGASTLADSNHGLVLGRIHLTSNGIDQRTGQRLPFVVKWQITEETRGTLFLIDHLPTDGPFVLVLPTGSYRVTAVSLDNALGIWQASLPTTFNVWSQECTYLGTWQLHMRTGFFDGSITRQVLDQQDRAQNDLGTIIGERSWPAMVAQLGSPMESSLLLTFQTQGTQLTSPP